MKILKRSLLVLLGLFLIYTAFVLSLPNQYGLSRSVTIKAPAEKIYALIAAPKEWKKWSIWNQRDPNMQMIYSGPDSGAGAKWEWKSKSEGNGNMKFFAAAPNQAITYELEFEGMGKPSTGALVLENKNGLTEVTWSMTGSSQGNFMMKYFVPFMDKMVGPDFETGLKNLKALAEKE